MGLKVDWDNYVLEEAYGFELWELEELIEDVREHADTWGTVDMGVPEDLLELIEALEELWEEEV